METTDPRMPEDAEPMSVTAYREECERLAEEAHDLRRELGNTEAQNVQILADLHRACDDADALIETVRSLRIARDSARAEADAMRAERDEAREQHARLRSRLTRESF